MIINKRLLQVYCLLFGMVISLSISAVPQAQLTNDFGNIANTVITKTPALIPNPPDLNVKGYVIMDADSGIILAQKNANKQLAPASLTKLMTLYIVAEELQQGRINLNDKVRISKKAWHMGGSRMFVRVGTKIPVKDPEPVPASTTILPGPIPVYTKIKPISSG